MAYIDGFVTPVPSNKRENYREHARWAAEIFKACGALSVVECWGEDVPEGELTSFSKAVQLKPDEVVCFSWIKWPSKKAREEGMPMAMERMRAEGGNPMPFDGSRMIFGGFEALFEL